MEPLTSPGDPYAPAPEPRDTFLQRLADLVAKPGRLMRNVGAAPRWWQAGLLMAVVVAASSWLIAPIDLDEQMERLEGKRDAWPYSMMADEDFAQMLDRGAALTPGKRIGNAVGGGLVLWGSTVVFGLILGFFVKMAGGTGTKWQAVGIVTWSQLLPFCLDPLVRTPLVLALGSSRAVNLGLAALVPLETSKVGYVLLTVYGGFAMWWGLTVMVRGFERVYGVTRQVAAVSVLAPWAVLSLINVGFLLLAL